MWDKALGHYVLNIAQQNLSQAELRLYPPELGALEVRVSLSQGEASVAFASPDATVRDALEAAVPRLRQMFTETGLTLAAVTVSPDPSPQQQYQGSGGYKPVAEVPMVEGSSEPEADDECSKPWPFRASQRLVDRYA
jgi:flagellar hook-length control protein FliK